MFIIDRRRRGEGDKSRILERNPSFNPTYPIYYIKSLEPFLFFDRGGEIQKNLDRLVPQMRIINNGRCSSKIFQGFVKCGYAGSNFPDHIFPSMVGRPMIRASTRIDDVEVIFCTSAVKYIN